MRHTGYLNIGAVAAMALSALASGARAQQAPQATTPTQRETEIMAGFTANYDSNVAGSDREIAAARGIKSLDDELFLPNASFVIARNVGAQLVFLQGNAGYVFHRVNTILNRQNVDVQLGANAHYLHCQEVPTAEFASFQTDLAEEALAAPVVKNTQNIGTFGGTLSCGRQIGLAPSVSLTETLRSNSAEIEKTLNSNSFSVAPALAYQQPALGALAIFGSYTDANFPNELFLSPHGLESGGGYDYYAGGVRLTHNVGVRLALIASLSYTDLVQKIPGVKGFSGLTYSGDVVYTASSRLTVHAAASRSTLPSLLPGANFSVSESFLGDLTYQLGPRLTLVLSDNYDIRDYPGLTSPPVGIPQLTHQKLNTVTVRGDYTLNRILVVGLFVTESNRDANYFAYDYGRVQAGLTMTAKF
jgi:Putative beta-barrel porin 2